MIKIRKVHKADKNRILDISSKIWEGEDYIDSVFDDWVSDKKREFVCLTEDDIIFGFASMRIMPDGSIWFEGLRVAPEVRGKGSGKMITEYLVDKVRKNGGIIRLATYFKNYESLHIVKKYGFQKIKGYNFLEKETSPVGEKFNRKNIEVIDVDFIPIDWVFYKNNTKNFSAIEQKVFKSVDKNGGIHVSLSEKRGKDAMMNIFKVDYRGRDDLKHYFAMAEAFAFQMKQKYICTMLPYDEKIVGIATEYGFLLWEDATENVVLLEKRF